MATSRLLDTGETDFGKEVRESLSAKIVSQEAAISYFVGLLEKYRSRLYDPKRPIGSILFTGPSGSGKTFAAETFAEAIQSGIARDWKRNMLKIDCAEFQHSHEIAKLIGSPPGYLGHRETHPMLSGERIGDLQGKDKKDAKGNLIVNPYKNDKYPFFVLLLDEIEKASDALWQFLLGILDHGTITLGTNETVDLTHSVIVMTSNTGFSDGKGGLGFSPVDHLDTEDTIRKGVEAAKRKFSVEFVNRLDGIVGFPALTRADVARVLKLELGKLQFEVFAQCTPNVLFNVSERAQKALLAEGYDPKYNARYIKRAIDKRLRIPLARIIGSKQTLSTEGIHIDFVYDKFVFEAIPAKAMGYVIHGSKEDLDNGEDNIL